MFTKQYRFIHPNNLNIEFTSYNPHVNKRYNDIYWTKFINNKANFGGVWMDSARVYAVVIRPPNGVNMFICGKDGEPAIRKMCSAKFIKRRFVFDAEFKSIRPELIDHPNRKEFMKKDKNHPLFALLRDDINMMVDRSQKYLMRNDKFQCLLMLESARCHIQTLIYPTKFEKYADLERVLRRLTTVHICLENIGASIR